MCQFLYNVFCKHSCFIQVHTRKWELPLPFYHLEETDSRNSEIAWFVQRPAACQSMRVVWLWIFSTLLNSMILKWEPAL